MKLDGLQVLRAFAATAVVFFHAASKGSWMKILDCGIDLFFVLSGFLMTYLFRPGKPWTGFLRKRALRVLPLYYFAILIAAAEGIYFGESYSGADWLRAVTLWPTDRPMLIVSWTLSHELLFYAVFSLLYLQRGLGLVALSTWLLSVLAAYATGWETFVTSHYNLLFFVGVGLALLVRRAPQAGGVPATLLVAAGVAALFGVNYFHLFVAQQDLSVRTLGNGAAAAALLLGIFWLEPHVRYPRWLVALGDASYSIYLVHLLPFVVGFKLLATWPALEAVRVPLLATFGVGAALACYALVERPLLRRMRSA
ncbi:MAG: acyltransferase family protein [Planctomycetota bacterium]